MSANRKGDIPRLMGKDLYGDPGRLLLSRSAFLGGDVQARFGPGQGYEVVTNGDKRPTDWMKVRTLLRVPQVAWLSLFSSKGLGFLETTEPYSIVVLGEAPPGFIQRTAFGPDGEEIDYYVFATGITTIHNYDVDEYQRLRAVYANAKSRIEAIRPGRTWVDINNFNRDLAIKFQSDGLVAIAAPKAVESAYLGTDFLHVYSGELLIDRAGLRSFVRIYTPTGPAVDVPAARLATHRPFFRGHSTRLFHLDSDWPVPGDYPGDVEASLGGYPVDFLSANATHDAHRRAMDTLAVRFEGFDWSHPGGTSLLTADSLVGLIADHFGFDAATGVDLPP